MVNWRDPEIIERCKTGFVDLTLFLLGSYGWYYSNSLQVELALLRGRLTFQWAMVSYMICRIFLLMSLILSATLNGPLAPYMDCDCTSKLLVYARNVVVACATTNLAILTWSAWSRRRSVTILLVIVTIGHWFILTFDSWGSQIISSHGHCEPFVVNPFYSGVAATYTTIFDFFLLKLTILGLWRASPSFSLRASLHSQGIIYFLIVFSASIIPLIFSWLNLNYIMNVIFSYTAAGIMTIASSRAVNSMNLSSAPRNRTPVVGLPQRVKENVQVTIAESPTSEIV